PRQGDCAEGTAAKLLPHRLALLERRPGGEDRHGEEHAPESGRSRTDIAQAHENARETDAGGADEQRDGHRKRGRCGPDGNGRGGHGVFLSMSGPASIATTRWPWSCSGVDIGRFLASEKRIILI